MAELFDFGRVMAPVNAQVEANQRQYGMALQNAGQAQQNQIQAMNVQAAQKQQQARQQFNQDWQAAAGDPEKLSQLAYKHPAMIGELKERLGLMDDIKAGQAAQTANAANIAIQQGPQAVQQFLASNQGALRQLGIDPNDAWQQFQQDPQGFKQTVDAVQLAGATTKDQLNHAQEVMKNQTTIRGQDLNAASQAADRNLRYLGIVNDRLNTQIAASKNDLERQKLVQQQQTAQQQKIDTQRDWLQNYESQAGNLRQYASDAARVAQAPDALLEAVTGYSGKINRAIPGSPEASFWNDIKQMQGQARLAAVQQTKGSGAISDAEGKAYTEAFLALDENSSPAQIRKAVNNWNKVLADRASAVEKTQGGRAAEYRANVEAADRGVPQQAVDYLRKNPDNATKEQFRAKYGYLPEGL